MMCWESNAKLFSNVPPKVQFQLRATTVLKIKKKADMMQIRLRWKIYKTKYRSIDKQASGARLQLGFSQLPQFLFDQLPCKNVVDESVELSQKACNNRIKHESWYWLFRFPVANSTTNLYVWLLRLLCVVCLYKRL